MFISVAYVYFFINCEQGRWRQPFICFLFFGLFWFSRSFFVGTLVSLFVAVKLISTILMYFGSRQVFHGW